MLDFARKLLRKTITRAFSPFWPYLSQLSYLHPTDTGLELGPLGALESTAVYDAVWVYGSVIRYLPFKVYQRLPDGDTKEILGHPLNRILHRSPNPLMTAFDFKLCMTVNLLLTGNAYAEIVRDENGRARQLYPWPSDKIRIEREGWNIRYVLETKEGPEVHTSETVFHLKGMSFDGLVGLSPTYLHRNSVALALTAEKSAAGFFKRGCAPAFVLKHPYELTPEARKNLSESFSEAFGGYEKSGSVPVLEEAMEVIPIGANPQESQSLDSRRYSVTDIARAWNLPPHKLGDMDRATHSNVEHLGMEFVKYSLNPHLTNWEQAVWLQLLSEEEQDAGHFAKFTVDALLRGDTEDQHRSFIGGIQNGYYSPNDVRRMLDLNKREGGDIYLVPQNLQPSGAYPAKQKETK